MSKVKIAVIAIASCFCVVAALGYNWYCTNSDLPFDPAAWAQPEKPNDRRRMVNDLKHKLKGLSKPDVEKLLGKPSEDEIPTFFYFDYKYLLGTERILFFEEEPIWLLIKFQDGIVTVVDVSG